MSVDIVKRYDYKSCVCESLVEELNKIFNNKSNKICSIVDFNNYIIKDEYKYYIDVIGKEKNIILVIKKSCKDNLVIFETAINNMVARFNKMPLNFTLYRDYQFLDDDPDLRKVKVGK